MKKMRETGSPSTALRRLVEVLATRGIRVETKRKGSKRALVVRRDGRRRVVEYWPHKPIRNLELLEALALLSPALGGAGMSRREFVEATGYTEAAREEKKEQRRVRRLLKRAAA